MISLADEIAAATQTLHLAPAAFRRVEGDERQQILDGIISRYVQRTDVYWWWEVFRCRFVVATFDGAAWRHWLSRLIESPERAQVWFVAGVDENDPTLLYETTVATAEAVLDECYYFEYYVAAHNLSWLAGENHHGAGFVLGYRLMRRLLALSREHPEEVSIHVVSPRRT